MEDRPLYNGCIMIERWQVRGRIIKYTYKEES